MRSTKSTFWPNRVRWQLLAAWRWPALIVVTLIDGAIVSALPPSGTHAKFIPSAIIAMFGNLFLVGAVAPWLAKRIAARRGLQTPQAQFPPVDSGEILVDRVATVLLVLGTVGLLATGLGNRKVVVADTNDEKRAVDAAQTFVLAHAPADVRANAEQGFLSPHKLEANYWRICGRHDDPHNAYCVYVRTKSKPASVRLDSSHEPNAQMFKGPGSGPP
ncbi:MAG: hypothetical protein ACJ77M_02170 [Thermoleophilaceae bacterium]